MYSCLGLPTRPVHGIAPLGPPSGDQVDPPSVLVATVRALLRLKRATEALATTEAHLETVLSNAPGMVFAVDAHGGCTLARGRALGEWQLTPETAVGRPFSEALPDENFRRGATRALAGERFIEELRRGERWYELCFAPLPVLHGGSAGFICLVNDITERRRDERMRERLLVHVAEDLRNPVYGIKVTSAALKQALSGPEMSRDYVDQAVTKIVRLADLAEEQWILGSGDMSCPDSAILLRACQKAHAER